MQFCGEDPDGAVPGVAELRVELQFIRCEPDFDVDFEVRLSRGGPRPRVVQHEPVRSGLRDCDCAGVGADLLLQLCSVLTDDSPERASSGVLPAGFRIGERDDFPGIVEAEPDPVVFKCVHLLFLFL